MLKEVIIFNTLKIDKPLYPRFVQEYYIFR